MEDYNLEVKGQVQQIYKVLSKDDTDKMPFQGIQIAKSLARIPFFRRFFDTNSQHFINLCIAQTVVEYEQGTNIYKQQRKQGAQRYMYIVLEGCIDASSNRTNKRTMSILRIFGQLQIVYDLPIRQQEVVCTTDCRLMRISQNSLVKIFTCKDQIKKCLHFLNVNPYFQKLNELQKMQLALALTKKSFTKGQVLKGQGQSLQNTFFFIYGRAQVITKLKFDKQEEYVIDELEQMSSFGEYECVTQLSTDIKVRGFIAGGYYQMNYPQIVMQQHRMTEIMKQQAIPYPNTQSLTFLKTVKQTLKSEQKRVIKTIK